MSSKRRIRRKACERKVKFASQVDAARAKVNMIRNDRPGARDVFAYRCGFCGQFHLGHRPKWAAQAVAARQMWRG